MDFILQPKFYGTSRNPTLMSLLERIWIADLTNNNNLGKGTFYILSGFANFNGGVRFYNYIEEHIAKGGRCRVILGGSSQNMSSQQVVTKLLEIGCTVGIVNRKAIFHAKCYGYQYDDYKSLIVSSGNFTSRGMTQNVEASILIENDDFKMSFDWEKLFSNIERQKIDYINATLEKDNPAWNLLYDENHGKTIEESTTGQTMVITLSPIDIRRIQAQPGTKESRGTQYFWLSKDSLDFFPPLNVKNERGEKNAYRANIMMNYVDMDFSEIVTITFEAENNLDFRLGTGALKNTRLANVGDMAAITRLDVDSYELRIIKRDSPIFNKLIQYATTFVGHKGKRYGYISNKLFYSKIK